MKNPLSVLFVFVLFLINYPAFAECEPNYSSSRIGRLPCPLVLKNCTTFHALKENHYAEKDEKYSVEEVQGFCKRCVIDLSRDLKCITRGTKKCVINFPTNFVINRL
jgi:hypothetical protein